MNTQRTNETTTIKHRGARRIVYIEGMCPDMLITRERLRGPRREHPNSKMGLMF